MYPPCPKPMEAASVARRGGLLAQSRPRPGIRARARTWGHGAGVAYSSPAAARRRPLLVASLGVGESLPAQPLGEEEGPVAAEVDEDADDSARILPPPHVPAKTVRVKFVLQKKCAFGQQFLVVGDDLALGQWDPAKAAALDWSEGHVWTVKTDLPANKSIEFKFLLRDASGHVRWQHGDNRSLQTNETQNTLVVHGDWDHVRNQRVSEEEELSIAAEDVTLSDDLAGSTDALLELEDEPRTGDNLEGNGSVGADASLHGEMKVAKEESQHQFILEEDQKLLDEINGKADTTLHDGHLSADDNNGRRNDDDTTLCHEDAQVANSPTSIFENDLAWARKALQQLLRFLGFQIGTTTT